MDVDSALVTTVIPTYQRPQLLARAIRSALDQTHPAVRVLVCDNASTDETAAVVTEIAACDARVEYHRHPENIGALANFNYGLSQVKTPFFSFLSDDDILLPDFYQTALDLFQRHPEAGFVSTNVVSVKSTTGEIVTRRHGRWRAGYYSPPEGFLSMIRYRPPTWTGTVFRTEVRDAVGKIDVAASTMADLDFLLRAAQHFPYCVTHTLGALFLVYPSHGSGRGTAYSAAWQAAWDHMSARLKGDYTESPDVLAEADRLLQAWYYERMAGFWQRAMQSDNVVESERILGALANAMHPDAIVRVIQLIGPTLSRYPRLRKLAARATWLALGVRHRWHRSRDFPRISAPLSAYLRMEKDAL